MVPRLHDKGTSFKGISAYLLRDKDRALTSERVAWTDTRNLATQDPDLAWRLQAACALNQQRLKSEAGVPNTGRKSNKHVLHFTLSWHPDQNPSREEMLRAAEAAIDVLGGSDRQALIVAHDDEPHDHLHIVINRVSPTDGRHLSSSKEKLKLSQWAEAYEKETADHKWAKDNEGKEIYCKNRRVNNAERDRIMRKPKHDRGKHLRAPKDTARYLLEDQRQEKTEKSANDNDLFASLKAAQAAKDHALALLGRNQAKQQAAAWSALENTYKSRQAAHEKGLRYRLEKINNAAFEAFRAQKIALGDRQKAEQVTFLAMERTFFGQMGNAAKTVKQLFQEGGSSRLARTFGISTNATRRLDFFEESQKRERDALDRAQDEKAKADGAPIERENARQMALLRQKYLEDRNFLAKRQEIQRQALQEDWAKRNAERKQALAGYKRDQAAHLAKQEELDRQRELAKQRQKPIKPTYDQAAHPAPSKQDEQDKGSPTKANSQKSPPTVVRLKDAFDQVDQRSQERSNDNERDR